MNICRDSNIPLNMYYRYSVLDNVVLDEVDKAEKEVKLYKASGGNTICELSVVGMRRANHSFDDLAHISKTTGVHILSTTGFYSESFLSPEVRAMSVQSLAEMMQEEIVMGSGSLGVKCGMIYISCSDPLKDTEKKTLEAAAITNRETGIA